MRKPFYWNVPQVQPTSRREVCYGILDNSHPLNMRARARTHTHTHTHTHTYTHTHINGLLMPSKYWGQLFIVQVVRLWSALHTWYCVSRTVHCTADPHCGCPHVWLKYLHRTFLRHSKAVNPALNMLENVTNGDLSIPAVLLSQMFSRRTPAIS
jgi:hypothetical protein